MFNFSEDDFVPGFRMKDPKDEVPGFRMLPDVSIQQNPADIWASAYRRYFAPDSWLTPGPASNQITNLAFGLGGGLTGGAADPTWPPTSSRPSLPAVEPVAAGDLKCEACRGGRPSGMTGAYEVEGRILCHKCAVKRLGFENEPSSDLPGILRPYSLQPK
jgi:hypothetical protein